MERIADINVNLQALARKADRKRRSDFLRPLNITLLVIHLLAVLNVIIISDGLSQISALAILGLSTAINIAIYILNQRGSINFAAILYCLDFNAIIIASFMINLLKSEYEVANIFAMMLSMIPLFIGILVGVKYIFWFATVNIVFVVFNYIYYFDDAVLVIRYGLPISVFIFLVALIAWLYQRTLVKSARHLDSARSQLMQDELLKQELEIARTLQSKLYPPPPASLGAVHIAAKAIPAMETSGDLYDFIDLDHCRIGIVVADVTGKSMAAALMMAMARSVFRAEARQSLSAGEVLTNVNMILCADTSIKQMITAWYGILDTRTLTLRFANAGHPFALLRRQGTVMELEAFGLPLRALADVAYAEETITLQPGDCLLLHTDGVAEMMNARRELFSFERLATSLQQGGDTSPDGVLNYIQTTLDRFRGPTHQHDDLTLVVVSVDPV